MTHPHPACIDNRRLVFAASPGRSGTKFLTRLLGTAETTTAFHEGKPNMSGPFLRAVAYGAPVDSYGERLMKVDALRSTLSEMPIGGVLVETSHMFIKTFADVVLDEFDHDRISILDVRRPLQPLISSMMELGWFTPWAPEWRDWLIPPTAPGSRFPIPPERIAGRVDVALGYVLDSEIRKRVLRASTPNVRWVDVMIDEMKEPQGVEWLFGELQLQPTKKTFVAMSKRLNERDVLKDRRDVAIPPDRLAHWIASFARRFETEIAAADLTDVFD